MSTDLPELRRRGFLGLMVAAPAVITTPGVLMPVAVHRTSPVAGLSRKFLRFSSGDQFLSPGDVLLGNFVLQNERFQASWHTVRSQTVIGAIVIGRRWAQLVDARGDPIGEAQQLVRSSERALALKLYTT